MSQSERPDTLEHASDENIRWWRPGWRDVFVSIGYRWFILIPVAILLLLSIVLMCMSFAGVMLLVYGFKLLLLGIGMLVSTAGYVVRRAMQARKEPFCIFCGYNLSGLPDNYRCPECGRAYKWEQIADYRRDPRWFIERWNLQRQLPQADTPLITPSTPRRRSRDGT